MRMLLELLLNHLHWKEEVQMESRSGQRTSPSLWDRRPEREVSRLLTSWPYHTRHEGLLVILWLIPHSFNIPNSSWLTEFVCMLDRTLCASSWIRIIAMLDSICPFTSAVKCLWPSYIPVSYTICKYIKTPSGTDPAPTVVAGYFAINLNRGFF